jgi:demethylmenaquinone methyltransferase / 2-methoxy-6-polyprenyl-1,4-benzoquinol methylase
MYLSLDIKEKQMVLKNRPGSTKNEQVEAMFDDIAHRYDFLNHFLSLGTDRFWRRKAINIIRKYISPGQILDVATGTGDLAIEALRLGPVKVTGIDISEKMLELGKKKILNRGLEARIELMKGDSQSIAFPENIFSVAMCAFGVRNFENPLKGLSEMCRVLQPGGMVMVLEFSKPSGFPLKQLYFFYFRRILPLIGHIVSGDSEAYNYLPESVLAFPEREAFIKLMADAGLHNAGLKRLSGGIATIYFAFKPE